MPIDLETWRLPLAGALAVAAVAWQYRAPLGAWLRRRIAGPAAEAKETAAFAHAIALKHHFAAEGNASGLYATREIFAALVAGPPAAAAAAKKT